MRVRYSFFGRQNEKLVGVADFTPSTASDAIPHWRLSRKGISLVSAASSDNRSNWVLFLVSGERLVKYIGHEGINVVTRLMGLILSVIGMQMLIQGIGGALSEFNRFNVG